MEIQPRPFGEVLSEGMALLARVWRRLLAPAFWSFTVLGGLTIVTLMTTGANDVVQLIMTDPLALEAFSDEELWDIAVQLGQTALVAGVLQLLAVGFLSLVAHTLVAAEMGGSPIRTGTAVSVALRRFPTLVLAGILAGILVILGLVALVVPGLWLAGAFTMTWPAIALEGTGPIESLRRSFRLVRGRWWPTVGFVLLVGLMGSAAAQLVQLVALPALAAGDGVGFGAGLGFVFLMVLQGFVVAAIAVMTTRWYVDLRARQERLLSSDLT
jgi:hypothetical protein